ncbi:hypothetical protein ACFJGV_03130 [Cnuibacter sp. UC19_7]|uniref:hypothetical protein n=1 Tax=Cnuibacter sp. UC19_7 TaxID=3350166 RepID=UPI00366D47F2
MELETTPASLLADGLAAEITHNYGRGRIAVAVDGIAGTRLIADELAAALRRDGRQAVRASLDDFRMPAERVRATPEGEYFDRYDVPTLQRVLLAPFKLGGSTGFQVRAFDAERDTVAESAWTTAGPDAYLVLDGPFLQRPGLRGRFNATVYVETRWAEVPEVLQGADELYQAEAGPRFGATAIVDSADPAHPRRVFADSC